jgi:hypothetical protein
MAANLGIDWEQLEAGDKKDKVRDLLLYLYHRNRVADLLAEMRVLAKPRQGRRTRTPKRNG